MPGTFSFVNFYTNVKDQWTDFVNFGKTTALLAHETMVILWKYFFAALLNIFLWQAIKYFLDIWPISHKWVICLS